MSGYLTHWRNAGDSPAGRILKTISRAGDHYHHTESWCDEDVLDESCADMIERVVESECAAAKRQGAIEALEECARLCQARAMHKRDKSRYWLDAQKEKLSIEERGQGIAARALEKQIRRRLEALDG